MAKNKKQSSRLFRAVKEQAKQKGTLIALSEMERLRNEKWLTMIFTVSATRVATDEAYRVFIDPNRISANLPVKCKNAVIELERNIKKLDKLIKDVIQTMDKEVTFESERVQNLLDSFEDDGVYDNYLQNTKTLQDFIDNLIKKVSPAELTNIAEAVNKKYVTNIPVFVRSDAEVFFVKSTLSSNYIPLNITQMEDFARKFEITDMVQINPETGKTNKVKKKYLKEIFDSTLPEELFNEYFKSIK